MTSPVTPGTASLLVGLGINPMTPKKPPKSPASIAERAEQTALRKRELETAAETDAADQALEASEMTVADPSAAPALKAAAKKARLDRKQATQAAFAKAQDTAAMPPPPKPGTQAKAGKDKKKVAATRIKKKKTIEAALPSDNTDAEERTGSGAGSAAPTRAGNTKVGTTSRTTAHCSPALSAHACTPQTTPNCNHKTQTTHHLSNSWTPLEFTDPVIKLELDQSSSKEKPGPGYPAP